MNKPVEGKSVGKIRRLDQSSIKLIAAGQKLASLASVIRELIENSIDARATNIDITLTDWGTKCIEVEDNGCGISHINFPNIALPNCTSKLDSLDSLQTLQTYGFRGEALSCLCSCSKLRIITRCQEAVSGSELAFFDDGRLQNVYVVARNQGTTVIVTDLFKNFPVRQQDLKNNGKKNYDQVVRIVYEYLLAQPSIKFSLSKKTATRKDKDFVHGGTTLEACLISIFSIKTFNTLIPFKQIQKEKIASQGDKKNTFNVKQESSVIFKEGSSSNSRTGDSTDNKSISKQAIDKLRFLRSCKKPGSTGDKNPGANKKDVTFTIFGYISDANSQSGRSSNEYQFIFVNKKPCQLPNLQRAINDTYKTYNRGLFPFVCLFINCQPWTVDFNVPNKREVIIFEETRLIEIVCDSLNEMYCRTDSTTNSTNPRTKLVNDRENSSISMSKFIQTRIEPVFSPHLSSSARTYSRSDCEQNLNEATDLNFPSNSSESLMLESGSQSQERRDSDSSQLSVRSHPLEQALRLMPARAQRHTQERTDDLQNLNTDNVLHETQSDMTVDGEKETRDDDDECNATISIYPFDLYTDKDKRLSFEIDLRDSLKDIDVDMRDEIETLDKEDQPEFPLKRQKLNTLMNTDKPSTDVDKSSFQTASNLLQNENTGESEKLPYWFDDDNKLFFDLEAMEKCWLEDAKARQFPNEDHMYRASIHPEFNAIAEQELKTGLNKESFSQMKIVGQFNRGFIITQYKSHLFIIDQHASDERNNYEQLLEKPPLSLQPLVYPKPLFLNALQENIVTENWDLFKKKGLYLRVDPLKPSGARVTIETASICQDSNLRLDREDVEELISVISESPSTAKDYTLNKIRVLVASKACRKSVMIGTPLREEKMKQIVANMGKQRNPWACAHGRPTIRHLMSLEWTRRPVNYFHKGKE